MDEQIEIQVIGPRKCSVSIPQYVYGEINRLVEKKDFGTFIVDALKAELKKTRFRKDMEKAAKRSV